MLCANQTDRFAIDNLLQFYSHIDNNIAKAKEATNSIRHIGCDGPKEEDDNDTNNGTNNAIKNHISSANMWKIAIDIVIQMHFDVLSSHCTSIYAK